jgi:hypothetical protein
MSNYLAIATVTAALRQMLSDAVNADVSGTEVSILPPDNDELKKDLARLNLYLYQVTPSAVWRNADLPARRADGSLASTPQLGLDLYYVMTAYGKATNNNPEIHRILGSAMRTLHERPILTRDTIRAVLSQNSLAESNLADQIELVKLTLQPLSMEELSKLWSVFFNTPYRVSVTYQAAVVLIDGKESPRPSLPVRDRNIYVMPFRRPEILEVDPPTITSAPGAKLTLRGSKLSANHVLVRFGTQETVPDLVLDDYLVVTLPAGIRAGVNAVQVIHKLDMGTPPTLHRGFESNVAAFILTPRITTPAPCSVAHGSTLTLSCDPPVGRTQRVILMLGEYEITIPVRSASGPETTVSLEFPIPADFPTGTYLMRISIDGAESALSISPDPLNPVYSEPLLEVT